MSIQFTQRIDSHRKPGVFEKPGFSRGRSLLLASAMLLSAGACATTGQPPQQAATIPPVAPVDVSGPARAASAQHDPHFEHAVVRDPVEAQNIIQPLGNDILTDNSAASARVPSPKNDIIQTSATDGVDAVPVSYAAEPRVHLASQPCPPGTMDCPPPVMPLGPMEMPPYPEEILCDGGDRLDPFHYEGDRSGGLDPEDTVADYVDHTGEAHVRISSRTCVYAPKFAAVRTISQPVLDYSVDRLAGAHHDEALAGLERELPAITQQQTDQLSAMQLRTRPNGLAATAGDMEVHLALSPDQHLKINNTYEDRGYQSEGRIHQTTEAWQSYGLSIAGESIHDIAPIIVANDVFGQTVIAGEHVEEYSVVEDPRPAGDLRVVKQADKLAIQPGDLLTYKITFFNDGGRELTKVRILDHLSPRLEYVPGSAITELEGRLNIELEPDGSQVLSFELADPLAGGASGEITFQVRAK